MHRALLGTLAALVGVASGCASDDPMLQRVPGNVFGTPPPAPAPTRAAFAPASIASAGRVDTIGRGILAANPQIGLRPIFVTIGAPKPEVFHRGTGEVDITEGLVNQCTTDAQLAAILCNELAKMRLEREARAGMRPVNAEPPPEVRIGNNSGSPDLTYLAEQAKFRPAAARQTEPDLPDPQTLARDYLTKAGFAPTELDGVEPLLRSASQNIALENQLTKPPPARPGTQ